MRSTIIIITILFAFPSAFGGSELFSRDRICTYLTCKLFEYQYFSYLLFYLNYFVVSLLSGFITAIFYNWHMNKIIIIIIIIHTNMSLTKLFCGPRRSRGLKKRKKKRMSLISSHLDRKSFVKIGFIILKRFRFKLRMTFYCESHKRKPTAFVAQYPKSRSDFLCFDRLLPLFATPPPTLSKNWEIC